MAYSPKRLAQFVASTVEITHYTVPEDTFTIIKNVILANTYPSAVSMSMSLVPLGQGAGIENRIVPGVSIAGNSSISLDLSTVMAEGDFISASAAVDLAVAVTISGVEESGSGLSTGSELIPAIPVSTIWLTAAPSAPTSWMLCDGSAISRTTYAALFAAIGTTYGAGNGTTTFNLPNLKGRVPVGRDAADVDWDVLGETRGAKTHTLITAEMPVHTHVQNPHNHDFSTAATAMTNPQNSLIMGAGNPPTAVGGQIASATATNQNAGSGTAHNNIQPSIVLNYMIKVT